MKETEEWVKVLELMDSLDDMTDAGATFIQELHDNLDPFLPFLDQCSEEQLKWLNSLYELHCNEDEDAAEDIYDDDL